MKKLGLSLSFCIRDIAEGRVDINDVHHIITACSPEREEHITFILEAYSASYWKNCKEKALEVFNTLREQNKICWIASFEKNPVCGNINWVKYEQA